MLVFFLQWCIRSLTENAFYKNRVHFCPWCLTIRHGSGWPDSRPELNLNSQLALWLLNNCLQKKNPHPSRNHLSKRKVKSLPFSMTLSRCCDKGPLVRLASGQSGNNWNQLVFYLVLCVYIFILFRSVHLKEVSQFEKNLQQTFALFAAGIFDLKKGALNSRIIEAQT